MHEQEHSKSRLNSTSLLAILTLIIAIVAAVPGFLSLNNDHADIYYSVNTSHVSIPTSLDNKKALSVLESNGIPGTTVELSIVNQGNSSADSVKLSIKAPVNIMAVWSTPSSDDNPIWVTLPEIKNINTSPIFQAEVTALSATMPLKYYVGYLYSPDSPPEIQVFYSGKPAVQIENISDVGEWSKWSVFILPLQILAGGVALILLWIFILALYRDPIFRDEFVRELIFALKSVR